MSGSRKQPVSTTTESPETSALERHIAYFGKDGLTYDSMRSKLIALDESEQEASKTANVVSFVGGVKIKWCPYRMFQAKEAVGVLNHPRDTSIFKLDGNVDEQRWEKLCTYSEIDEGTEIITEAKFYEFLKWCRDNDTRWDVTGFGKKASDGEWDGFFRHCTDHWKNGTERCVTLKTLRTFYDNTPEVFDKVADKALPIPKPNM